ncbi:MAG: hypothetical protein HY062_13650 [Bacteroidetes bacterium]|nr:hypothetical protein [Bacteroidota bacterium]
MKKKILLIITVIAIAVGGTIYGFTNKSDCQLAGTKECSEYQNCPKKGQDDCPIVQNCPKKGTDDCPYTNGKSSCCAKK